MLNNFLFIIIQQKFFLINVIIIKQEKTYFLQLKLKIIFYFLLNIQQYIYLIIININIYIYIKFLDLFVIIKLNFLLKLN